MRERQKKKNNNNQKQSNAHVFFIALNSEVGESSISWFPACHETLESLSVLELDSSSFRKPVLTSFPPSIRAHDSSLSFNPSWYYWVAFGAHIASVLWVCKHWNCHSWVGSGKTPCTGAPLWQVVPQSKRRAELCCSLMTLLCPHMVWIAA